MNCRFPRPVRKLRRAFTLVEMLVVMVIIAILAGLILSGAGFAQKTAAKKRAKTEIAAMEAALESYKADNGIYPRSGASDALDPKDSKSGNPSGYKAASLELYKALSGDTNANRKIDAGEGKQYMEFSPSMLEPSGGTGNVSAVIDPFGSSYGYSTKYAKDAEGGPGTPGGYNPTFDLWSTAGKTVNPTPGAPGDVTLQWVTNW